VKTPSEKENDPYQVLAFSTRFRRNIVDISSMKWYLSWPNFKPDKAFPTYNHEVNNSSSENTRFSLRIGENVELGTHC